LSTGISPKGRTPKLVSLHLLKPFVIVANSHHPEKFEIHWRFLQGFASKERILSMGNDRDYGDSVSTRLTYFLVGAGIGAVLALLFAPKSGEELRSDIADATRKGLDKSKEAAQQLGAKASEYYDASRAKAGELYDTARETAGEYYEATRDRAAELYDTATAKAGDVVTKTRDAASRQAGSIAAAVDAGKKAYVEEKRKTELSGRTEAAPTYKPEKSM
jgi:gas vesicle protein